MPPSHHPLLRSDDLGELSLDVGVETPATVRSTRVHVKGDRASHITCKRNFLTGAEVFVRPSIDF